MYYCKKHNLKNKTTEILYKSENFEAVDESSIYYSDDLEKQGPNGEGQYCIIAIESTEYNTMTYDEMYKECSDMVKNNQKERTFTVIDKMEEKKDDKG